MAIYLHIRDNDSNHECRAYRSIGFTINRGYIILRACIKSVSGTTATGGGISLWVDSTQAGTGYAYAHNYIALNYDANAHKLNLESANASSKANTSASIVNPLGNFVIFELRVDYYQKKVVGTVYDSNGNVIQRLELETDILPESISVLAVNGCGGSINGDLYADWVKLIYGESTIIYDDFENNDISAYSLGLCANSTLDTYQDANATQCSDPLAGDTSYFVAVPESLLVNNISHPVSPSLLVTELQAYSKFAITDYTQSITVGDCEWFQVYARVKNVGNKTGTVTLRLIDDNNTIISQAMATLNPGQEALLYLHSRSPADSGNYTYRLQAYNEQSSLVNDEKELTVTVQVIPKLSLDSIDLEVYAPTGKSITLLLNYRNLKNASGTYVFKLIDASTGETVWRLSKYIGALSSVSLEVPVPHSPVIGLKQYELKVEGPEEKSYTLKVHYVRTGGTGVIVLPPI